MASPLLKKTQRHYLKIMFHALHRSKEVIFKGIELNMFYQNSLMHMNSRRMMKLIISKYVQFII